MQRLNDIPTFNERRHCDASASFAIDLGYNQVLRNVDKPASQVPRVGCLECRIGETLASAVRRDEVLQYVQAFAEVSCDRCFDD